MHISIIIHFATHCVNTFSIYQGAPSKGYLEQSITSEDNPYLRANVQAIKAREMSKTPTRGKFAFLLNDSSHSNWHTRYVIESFGGFFVLSIEFHFLIV